MTKKELLDNFAEDFDLLRGALTETLSHNRNIDGTLVDDLSEGDFKKLEEHTEISKIIMDSVKSMTELYKNAPVIIENIDALKEEKPKKEEGSSLADLMSTLSEEGDGKED